MLWAAPPEKDAAVLEHVFESYQDEGVSVYSREV